MLTNREIAILIWSLLLLGVGLASSAEARKSVLGVGRALLARKVAIPLALFMAWLGGVVFIAAMLGVWNHGLLKGTIVWTLFSGIALFLGLTEAIRERGYFVRAVGSTLRVTAFVEYAIAFRSFPLVVELVIQPLLFIVAMVRIFAAHREDGKQLEKLTTAILGIAFLAMLGRAIHGLITDWGGLSGRQELLELAQPVWLTVAALPYVFIVSVAAAYEDMFLQVRWSSQEQPRCFHRLALVTGFGPRLGLIRTVGTRAAKAVGRSSGFRASMEAIRDVRGRAAEEKH